MFFYTNKKYANAGDVSGFTLLEVLVVLTLFGMLSVSLSGFFLYNIHLFHSLHKQSELLHQARTGLETLVQDLQEANPPSICLSVELSPAIYGEIMFSKNGSSDLYWYYVNSAHNLIKACKRPDSEWGRNVVAEKVDFLRIKVDMTNNGLIKPLSLHLKTRGDKEFVEYTTMVSPGFE